ncbi:unnamed protein product [Amoebophrya sp. A25]|nr:unnamed protein product [Amoebophrya sp. A25]|eukprot:GSA25T00011932001.1
MSRICSNGRSYLLRAAAHHVASAEPSTLSIVLSRFYSLVSHSHSLWQAASWSLLQRKGVRQTGLIGLSGNTTFRPATQPTIMPDMAMAIVHSTPLHLTLRLEVPHTSAITRFLGMVQSARRETYRPWLKRSAHGLPMNASHQIWGGSMWYETSTQK